MTPVTVFIGILVQFLLKRKEHGTYTYMIAGFELVHLDAVIVYVRSVLRFQIFYVEVTIPQPYTAMYSRRFFIEDDHVGLWATPDGDGPITKFELHLGAIRFGIS